MLDFGIAGKTAIVCASSKGSAMDARTRWRQLASIW